MPVLRFLNEKPAPAHIRFVLSSSTSCVMPIRQGRSKPRTAGQPLILADNHGLSAES